MVHKEEYDDKTLRKWKELICRNPKDSRGYHLVGMILDLQNKYSEAEIQYRRSLKMNPSAQESCLGLAFILIKQGRYKEAEEQVEKKHSEEYLPARYNLCGYLKFILGKYEESIENYEKAISREKSGNSEESLPYFNKSMSLYALGKPELALKISQETLEKFTSSKNWHKNLQIYLLRYIKELNRFKDFSKNENLGENEKEQLIIKVRSMSFVVDLLKKELGIPLELDVS